MLHNFRMIRSIRMKNRSTSQKTTKRGGEVLKDMNLKTLRGIWYLTYSSVVLWYWGQKRIHAVYRGGEGYRVIYSGPKLIIISSILMFRMGFHKD